MMFIEENIIKQILVELCEILSNRCIVTGSCADLFNIGYTQIEDFDLVIEETSYNALPKEYMSNLKQIRTLKHKKDQHILKKFLYKNYTVDLMIKKESLIDKDIHTVNIHNKSILVFGNEARYNQLKTYNYRKTTHEKKYPKMLDRMKQYERLLDKQNGN